VARAAAISSLHEKGEGSQMTHLAGARGKHPGGLPVIHNFRSKGRKEKKISAKGGCCLWLNKVKLVVKARQIGKPGNNVAQNVDQSKKKPPVNVASCKLEGGNSRTREARRYGNFFNKRRRKI